jgi:hypothetical protein
MFKIKIDTKVGAAQMEVAPPLINVLLRAYNQIPSLQFEVLRENTDETVEVDGDKYYRTVTVIQGFQQLGTVSYKRRHHRGEDKLTFAVSCDNIKKKRGNRNAVITEHASTATKKIIEFFKPKQVDLLGKEVYDDVRAAIHDIHWRAQRDMLYSYNRQDEVTPLAVGFIIDVMDSNGSELPKIPELFKSIVTDKLRESWHTYEIVYDLFESFAKCHAVAIKHMRDGSYLLVDKMVHGNSKQYITSHFPSREDIVQPYMDKVSMLQFTEVNQAVRNVGIRMKCGDGDLYVIVNGDIITDS